MFTYFLWQEWRSVWLDRFSQRRFGPKYRKHCEFHKLSLLNVTMLGFRSFWPILIRLSLWQKVKMYCRLLFNHPSTCKSFKKWNVSKVSSLALLMLLLVCTVFLLVSSCMKITPFWPFWENQKCHSDNRIKILTPLIYTKYPPKNLVSTAWDPISTPESDFGLFYHFCVFSPWFKSLKKSVFIKQKHFLWHS